MSTRPSFIDHLLDLSALGPRLTTRRMFGEYALYVDGKVVAFACDDRLFVKYVEPTRPLTDPLPSGQAYPGSKPYAIADELLDDAPALRQLLVATADALPLPRPKPAPRRKRVAGTKA
ncbi:MAG: TfoX/Sxy family protein [Lautropia sp.]